MRFTSELDWVASQRGRMESLVKEWAAIPSESHDVEGLAEMARSLERSFATLGPVEAVDLPPTSLIDSHGTPREQRLGRALRIVKRPRAPRRVLCVVHMDTVHAREASPPIEALGSGRLGGPGVTDAKGGLAVLRIALEALERSDVAERVGWEVILNPDEEISSPGSGPLITEAARTADAGFAFEPALPDGALVGARKGSGAFTAVVHGRAAHVGREFRAGRSAITAAARFVSEIDRLNAADGGVIANVGKIFGGRALNIVPDLAIVGVNVRCDAVEEQVSIQQRIEELARELSTDGVRVDLHGGFTAPPKPLDERTTTLLAAVAESGRELDLEITWRATGGVSDGNRMAAAGLPTVDTMGPRGGDIHTPGEYLIVESLVERARLAALVLLRLAAGEIAWPRS